MTLRGTDFWEFSVISYYNVKVHKKILVFSKQFTIEILVSPLGSKNLKTNFDSSFLSDQMDFPNNVDDLKSSWLEFQVFNIMRFPKCIQLNAF